MDANIELLFQQEFPMLLKSMVKELDSLQKQRSYLYSCLMRIRKTLEHLNSPLYREILKETGCEKDITDLIDRIKSEYPNLDYRGLW